MNKDDKEVAIANAIKNINRTAITEVCFNGIFHIRVYLSNYARVSDLYAISIAFRKQFKGPISEISFRFELTRMYMEIVLTAPLTSD